MESDDKIIKPAFGIMSSAGSVSIPPILIFKGIAKQKEKNYKNSACGKCSAFVLCFSASHRYHPGYSKRHDGSSQGCAGAGCGTCKQRKWYLYI